MAEVREYETPTATPADYEPHNYDNEDDAGLFGNTPDPDPADAPPAPLVDNSGQGELPPEQLDQISAVPSGQSVQTAPLPTSPQPAIDQAFRAGETTSKEQGNVSGAIGEKQEAEAKKLEDEATQARLDELDRKDLEDQHKAALAKADLDLTRAQEAVKDFQYHDFWEDKPAGSKALAILFSAVGGGASTYAKQPNYALEELTRLEERDFKKQQSKLLTSTKFAEWKKEGVKDLEGRLGQEMAQLKFNQAEKLKHLGDYAQAQYLRSGKTVEQAQSNVLSAKLYQQAAEKRSDAMLALYKANLSAQAKKRAASAGAGHARGMDVLVKMKEDGKSLGEIQKTAQQLGIPSTGKGGYLPLIKDVESTAARKDVEQRRTDDRTVRDLDGNDIGTAAGGTRTAAKTNGDVAAAVNLIRQIEEYRDNIKRYGHLLNSSSTEAKDRLNLQAAIMGKSRVFAQLGVTDANIKLEHAMVGGHGVGVNPMEHITMSDPKVLDKFIKDTKDTINVRLRANVNPLPTKNEKTKARSLDDFAKEHGL